MYAASAVMGMDPARTIVHPIVMESGSLMQSQTQLALQVVRHMLDTPTRSSSRSAT